MSIGSERSYIGRRRFLGLVASSLIGTAALAACSSQPAAPAAGNTPAAASAPASAPTSAPASAAPTATAATSTSSSAAAPAATAAGGSTEAITLYWDTFRGVGTPWPQHMIDTYTKQFPNRKIVLRPIPIPGGQQEAYPKMYAMYAAGQLGDNIAFDPSHWEFYRAVPQGLLRPVDDFVAQDKLDLTQWFKSFIDMQHYKGKMWGLPSWGWTGQDGLHFNEVALEEAGLTVPDHNSADWTMDKVREYANKLNKKNGNQVDRYGIDLAMGAAGVTIIARTWVSDIISDDGKKALLTDPKVMPAMQWIYDICQTDKVDALPGSIPSGKDNALFSSGKIGVLQGGSLSVTELDTAIKDPKVTKLKSVLFPKRPDGKHPNQLRGGTWNVNSKSKYPYEAWQFINVLSSYDGILTFNTEGDNGALTRPDVLKNDFFTKNANFQVFLENLNNAILAIVPFNAHGTEYETTFSQSFANVYLGKSDFKTALQNAQDAVQAVLDKPAT